VLEGNILVRQIAFVVDVNLSVLSDV